MKKPSSARKPPKNQFLPKEYKLSAINADKEATNENPTKAVTVDPKALSWIPWMVHYTWLGGSKILSACDYVGEKLAWTLGVTSPKYFYEIEEYKRSVEAAEEEIKKSEAREKGWKETQPQTEAGNGEEVVIAEAPKIESF